MTATIHTVFGFVFGIGALCHLFNNFVPIKSYIATKYFAIVLLPVALLFTSAFMSNSPLHSIMDRGARLKAQTAKEVDQRTYELIKMNTGSGHDVVIDLFKGPHYWHPQMAIWVEDLQGKYIETLFISKATAEGLFYGGRSKENFKSFDRNKDATGSLRRVNALPIWSHKRGVQYADGLYVPTEDEPITDGITGATIINNFKIRTGISDLEKKVLKIEVNVAFDDNEYYSEFDFPDDEVFHSGTGQLGQPSILFETIIDASDDRSYYLMELTGHGHQSGQNGEISFDLSTLTTAKHIVERIVVGVN